MSNIIILNRYFLDSALLPEYNNLVYLYKLFEKEVNLCLTLLKDGAMNLKLSL